MVALMEYSLIFFNASVVVLKIALESMILGLILGVLFAMLESSKNKLVSFSVSSFTLLLRGLPEMLLVLLIFFGLSDFIELITGLEVDIEASVSAVISLSLIFASYASQTLKSAMHSIHPGQWEVSKALGFSGVFTFFKIILPQLWKNALPGLGNLWLVLLKDTSLISLIGINDLMRTAVLINNLKPNPFVWYGTASIIYLIITLISRYFLHLLEKNSYKWQKS